MLAFWHRRQGNAAEADSHARRRSGLAPVVLVQRFERSDGTPLVGGGKDPEVPGRVQPCAERLARPGMQLTFFDLTTDHEGCIRLPVYRTVYRLHGVSHPEGYSLDLPQLGWFEARGKVGLMPAATVRHER